MTVSDWCFLLSCLANLSASSLPDMLQCDGRKSITSPKKYMEGQCGARLEEVELPCTTVVTSCVARTHNGSKE